MSSDAKRQKLNEPVSSNTPAKVTDSDLIFEEPDATFSKEMRTIAETRETGQFCDIKVKVGAKLVPAHRNVLAARIPYFKTMFMSGLKESKQIKVEIKGVEDTVIEDLINFVYTGKIRITTENVESLLLGADYLHMASVKRACAYFYRKRFSCSNVCKVRSLADTLNYADLREAADEYVAKNFFQFELSPEFCRIENHQTLIPVLKQDSLVVFSEEQVFEAIMKWLKYKWEDRKAFLFELFSCVRLIFICHDFLVAGICQEDSIKASSECRDLIDAAKDVLLTRDKKYLGERLNGNPRLCYNLTNNEPRAAVIFVMHKCTAKSSWTNGCMSWTFSPNCVIRKTAWKLEIYRSFVESKEFLSVKLQYCKGPFAEISTEFSISIIHLGVSSAKHSAHDVYKFNGCNVWNSTRFIPWSVFSDPSFGYIKNDTLMIEVRISVLNEQELKPLNNSSYRSSCINSYASLTSTAVFSPGLSGLC